MQAIKYGASLENVWDLAKTEKTNKTQSQAINRSDSSPNFTMLSKYELYDLCENKLI